MTDSLADVLIDTIANHYKDGRFVLSDVLDALADVTSFHVAGIQSEEDLQTAVADHFKVLCNKIIERQDRGDFVSIERIPAEPKVTQ